MMRTFVERKNNLAIFLLLLLVSGCKASDVTQKHLGTDPNPQDPGIELGTDATLTVSGDSEVAEGSSLAYEVKLSNPVRDDVHFKWMVQTFTAAQPSDFVVPDSKTTSTWYEGVIPSGQSQVTLNFSIPEDTQTEGNEVFWVNIDQIEGAESAETSYKSAITIVDNEPDALATVDLSGTWTGYATDPSTFQSYRMDLVITHEEGAHTFSVSGSYAGYCPISTDPNAPPSLTWLHGTASFAPATFYTSGCSPSENLVNGSFNSDYTKLTVTWKNSKIGQANVVFTRQ